MGSDIIRDKIAIYAILDELKGNIDEQERNIYIVAGVLGGVDLALIIAVIVLLALIFQIKNKIRDAEVQKKIEEEINAQKLMAYTGEEMHRKLMAVTNPAVPLSQTGVKPESEYAFNAPFVDTRVMGAPAPNGMPAGSSAARFPRY